MTFSSATIEIDNVAALEAAVASGAMVPTQISARAPKGKIFAADLGSSIVTNATMDADYSVSGAMSETQVTFGWVLESDASQILTRDVIPGDFAIHPAGAQHDARHVSKLAYVAMTSDMERLRAIADFEGIHLDWSMFDLSSMYRPSPQWAQFSVQFAQQNLTSLETMPKVFLTDTLGSSKARKMLVDDMIRLLLHSLVQSDLAEIETQPISLMGRKIVRDAQQVLAENAEHKLDMDDLCEIAGVSKRTLFRAFQSYVGMSPARYIKLYRLSRAHIELCHSNKRDTQVGLVAYKWGFHHFGRFAADYRAIFNQSPSDTLKGPVLNGGKDDHHFA